MSQAEITTELLRAEFPNLRPDHDPDVERYYDLRNIGRPADALALYNSRLRSRYPDDDLRSRILKGFRLRSPEYGQLLSKAYKALGDRLLERVKRDLKYISLHAQAYNPRDAYSTIKAAEAILAMLPRERFEAIAAAERLRRYADILGYCAKPMAMAEDLVRAYLTESLDVVKEEQRKKREAREQAAQRHRSFLVEQDRASIGNSSSLMGWQPDLSPPKRTAVSRRVGAALDLSSLRFSAADLARIQIPPTLTKVEDQTLAFCFKYWSLCNDAALERVIFLYSRKYGTKHYEIFMAIRLGRRSGHRDEEILNAVSGLLITGYYYSIRGDIYVQRSWALLKAKLERPAPGAEESEIVEGKKTTRQRPSRSRVSGKKPAAKKRKSAAKKTPLTEEQKAALEAEKLAKAAARAAAKAARDEEKAARSDEKAAMAAGKAAARKAKAAAVAAAKAAASDSAAFKARVRSPNGSVSDQLKKLSGRSYDVFQDRFLTKVRPSIRHILSSGLHKSLFTTVPEEAEELVFAFLRDHYNDPYMDWLSSSERAKLIEMGFSLEKLEGVIEHCYTGL